MTEAIRMLRGDWLLEALNAVARNEAHWEDYPSNHKNPNAVPGRFHAPTQSYWQDAREDPGIPKPQYMTIRIPGEPDVDYEGEELTITPTQVRDVHEAFAHAGVLYAFRSWTQRDDTSQVAYYDKTMKKVVWGMVPKPIRQAALIASDCLPPTATETNE